jgi:hypothetical protein
MVAAEEDEGAVAGTNHRHVTNKMLAVGSNRSLFGSFLILRFAAIISYP